MFRSILYKYTYMYITTVNKKGDHELRGGKKEYTGGAGRGKRKGERM